MENNSIQSEPVSEQENTDKWKIYMEAAKSEYEYAHANANRLDNKVYILLAVCAFLFPILHSARIQTADFMSSWPVPVLTAIRFSPLICLSCAIILLLYAIKTVQISRVDVFGLLNQREMYDESLLDIEQRFAWAYAFSRNAGKAEQDRKYKIAYTALVLI
ncbi:MAG: hypothetical protein IJ587_03360, partial [Synergistaceae bacterium]|nr:hypothetical protein [Synergistaceae bacterium]